MTGLRQQNDTKFSDHWSGRDRMGGWVGGRGGMSCSSPSNIITYSLPIIFPVHFEYASTIDSHVHRMRSIKSDEYGLKEERSAVRKGTFWRSKTKTVSLSIMILWGISNRTQANKLASSGTVAGEMCGGGAKGRACMITEVKDLSSRRKPFSSIHMRRNSAQYHYLVRRGLRKWLKAGWERGGLHGHRCQVEYEREWLCCRSK